MRTHRYADAKHRFLPVIWNSVTYVTLHNNDNNNNTYIYKLLSIKCCTTTNINHKKLFFA